MPVVIGVKFRSANKVYYFDPKGIEFHVDDNVVVETVRGQEFAKVAVKNKTISDNEISTEIKPILRRATEKDAERFAENEKKEKDAYAVCEKLVEKHNLKMKLINVEYTLDRSKAVFNFTAPARVDFRDLVKELAGQLKIRIELHQIYDRDCIRMQGAMGICGRLCCCMDTPGICQKATIKMAKNQNVALNPAKVTGVCGKLVCCLKYENDYYVQMAKDMPKPGATVQFEGVEGKVLDTDYLREKIKVEFVNENKAVEIKYLKNGEYSYNGNIMYSNDSKEDEKEELEDEIPEDLKED